jgi:hypothetical protein
VRCATGSFFRAGRATPVARVAGTDVDTSATLIFRAGHATPVARGGTRRVERTP